MSKGYDSRSKQKIKEAVRIALRLGPGSLDTRGGKLSILEGLLTTDLDAPTDFGDCTTVDLQIWYSQIDDSNNATLVKTSPVETVTLYNFDPSLSLDAGAYVWAMSIGGLWRPVPISCDSYPESL